MKKISPITTLYICTHPQPDPTLLHWGVPGASGASLDPYCRGVPTRKAEKLTKNPLPRGVKSAYRHVIGPQDRAGKVRGGVEVGFFPHGSGAVLWPAGDTPSATQNPHEDNVGISGHYPSAPGHTGH